MPPCPTDQFTPSGDDGETLDLRNGYEIELRGRPISGTSVRSKLGDGEAAGTAERNKFAQLVSLTSEIPCRRPGRNLWETLSSALHVPIEPLPNFLFWKLATHQGLPLCGCQ
jgi:hypothetical protein